ncbi:MAG TPA: MATE family efflux transporter [Humisphaera sp.]
MTRAAPTAAEDPDAGPVEPAAGTAAPAAAVPVLGYEPAPVPAPPTGLLWPLLVLVFPTVVENVLHMFVGLWDVSIAGRLGTDAASATAAIGTVAYVLWLVNLIGSAIGTGATAIVARAVGARHRSLANSVTGQAVAAAFLTGVVLSAVFAAFPEQITALAGLTGRAHEFARFYFQVLSLSLPFSLVTVAAGSCLRGAGDSVSPAVAMVAVDGTNMLASAALTFGWFGLPAMGFRGIAFGTVIAYTIGGLILVGVLLRGTRVRLHTHRLRPHWHTLRRLLKVGLPNGAESLLVWPAQFTILGLINHIDGSNVSGAAHIVTIRVESMSFMLGLAFMSGAATLVGQSLGMKDPVRAVRATWLSFRICLVVMVSWGLAFVFAGRHLAGVVNGDPRVIDLAAQCLFVTAFAQVGFAAALVFGGALRGAGDTVAVMIINTVSQLGLRLVGVVVAIKVLHLGLPAVWMVLGGELTLRGAAIFARFLHGGWKHVKV